MSIDDLLSGLAVNGVELWVEGDRLRFRAPPGALDASQRAQIVARRPEVMARLRVRAAEVERSSPLSFSQRSLWFLHQQAPHSTAYHVAFTARIRSTVMLGALRHALQALVDRHPVLRTVYAFDDATPVQRVLGDAPVAFEQRDVAGLADAALRAQVEADYARPFDLEHGPVFRATLFTRADDDHVLLLDVHHIAADGWSLLLLVEELRKLYAEGAGGAAAGLARPQALYTDYVAWQAESLAGAEGERLWSYWRDRLEGPRSALSLPTDRPRPPLSSFGGASVPLQLDAALTGRVRDLSRELGTTPFVVLLASFHAFLHALSGNADIVVGTPAFARSKPEYMAIVGDFVNSMPLVARLAPTSTFRELVAQLRETVLGALDAQDYPLPLLVQRLQPERESGRSPLFDTFFALQRFDQFRDLERLLIGEESEETQDFGGLRLSPWPLNQQEGQFDLALQMMEQGGRFHGVLKYSTDLFDAATVRRLADGYLRVAAALLGDADTVLGGLAALAVPAADNAAAALLERLAQRDIRLVLDGGKLRVNAPKGALDDRLKAEIGARRDELVALLASAAAAPARNDARHVRAIARGGRLPISSAQQRLWFLDRIDPGRAHYNVGAGLVVRGVLKPALLREALALLIARHEALRTRFVEDDGTPMAELVATPPVPFESVDLSAASDPEAEATRRADALLKRGFDLAQGPLCAVELYRLADDHHVLAMSLHHIAADGWSLMIVMRELWQGYEALAGGQAPSFAPLAIQGADYAAWEQEQLHDGRMARQLAHWKQQLAGAPAALELPTDRPRPAAQSFRGGRVRRDFSPALLEALKARARRHEATLYMLLLAAWQVLLHRASGQDDIVVGSPMANRDLPAFEPLVGCLVNNIVLRGQLAGNPRFGDFLAQVKRTTLDAFDHRELPFDMLVDGLNPERSASHAPVFQVLFTLLSFPVDLKAPGGLSIAMLDLDAGAARFDLTLELVERDGGLSVLYEYASDLFDERSIVRMHGHFERLLTAIGQGDDVPVGELPLLADEDRSLLLGAWNDTAVAHDRGRCVHQLLEATARAAPDRVAVTAGATTLTFGELDRRANRLAHLLRARGVERGDLVAVCVDRDELMPIAIAAVLKAGAAYVPLDPTHPADRLRYTLEDAGVACSVTLARFAPLLAGGEAPLVALDEAADELAALPDTDPCIAVRPEDLAYVIYTSGSTGKPKGVEVEHRNVVAFLEAMRREPGLVADDVLLAVTTLSFDIAGLEMWLPLMVGARIVIASRTDVLDGERLIAMLEQHGVTLLQATPATWRLMIEAGWRGRRALKALCGGEALPRDLAIALVERVGELWNVYGPTETTIWSTAGRVTDPMRPISVGKPIFNTRIYVLEASGQPAPIGVPGELCIGGEGVARGYRQRPELTAEKFCDVTLPDGRVERVYRTGDVARWRGDGELEFIGRRDHQVKVRGYRIELGEIEANLARHPGVRQCAVVVREDRPGDQRLVGYVVADAAFDAEAARTTLRAALPEYMVPNAFMTLAALPLTPNGKVDRKALPRPEAAAPVRGPDPGESLMTPAQRRVAAIWRDTLHVERVGLHQNFFDLGGHSLLLVKLHAALKREFATDMALVELFQRTTVAGQADRLVRTSSANDALQRAQERARRQALD